MGSEDVGKLYPAAKAVLTPLFRAAWRFDLQGLENIPATGGAILCPNHTSVLDSFFVPAMLPRRVTYVGKAEYMDDWKTRRLFPALGMIPIDRTGGDAAERALATAQRLLENGELFGIYPEGTRSRDGRLYRGKTGPARLALRTGAPIIPIGIQGAREVMPPDARFPRLRLPVTITFGTPIDVTRYQDRANDRMVLRQIMDEVMYEIRELSGQEYVNEYAGSKKPAAAATIDLRTPVKPTEAEVEAQAVPTEPTPVGAGSGPTVRNGNGNGNGTKGPNGHGATETGGEAAGAGDHEFARATRPRSSADVLRNPPRRAHLTR
ncbi:MAG: 1-acyl-sn-glycerol-3-phosphate acyltransferase [Acidimicrobiales bacterium]|nr:1-acyl-sn-glycerol-3-phosphate acyltransferase [Acidimicrobiales bacterium]